MTHRLPITSWLTLHGMVTVVAVLIYVISSHVMQQRRHPTAAISWILFILLMPYLALPAYLTFGSRKLARPRSTTCIAASAPMPGDTWAAETLKALGQPAPAGYRALAIHADGTAARIALFEIIDSAQASLDVCTFILAPDRLGEAVVAALARRVRNGIRVRLLLDGLGRVMGGRADLTTLTRAGGEVCWFVPPLHSPMKGRTNLRNHRKMVVADAGLATARLWCGGRNLASEYFDGCDEQPAWSDLTFDVQGPLVRQAEALFTRDWDFAGGRRTGDFASLQEHEAPISPEGRAQLVASGPDQADDTVHALLVTAAYRAQRRIALATPYFVPDAALLMALTLAARRGVVVDLLLPTRSNHWLSDLARTRALRSLASAGARIWMLPGMLHAKLAVFDDRLALVGSANLDGRSLFLNYELMMAFHSARDVLGFTQWFDAERSAARLATIEPAGLMRDIAEGMVLWVGFQL